MKIQFLGTGAALDCNRADTSVMIMSGDKTLVIDCGDGVVDNLIKLRGLKTNVDAILITHLHDDHTCGIAKLALAHGLYDPESKMLIASPLDNMKKELAYRVEHGYSKERLVNIKFKKINPSNQKIFDFEIQAAETKHFITNYSYSIMAEGLKVGISGDGELTEETKKLFSGCDLLIHEAFLVSDSEECHSSVVEVLDYCKEVGIKQVMLVHIKRSERNSELEEVIEKYPDMNVIVPNDLDYFELYENKLTDHNGK